MSRDEASRYLDAPQGLCAMKIGGWAPHELHEHEAEEVARDRPRASGWRTSPRPGRATCSSCRRLATGPGKAAGSAL